MRNRMFWIFSGIIMAAIFTASNIPDLHLYNSEKLSPEWLVWISKHTLRFGKGGFFSYMISPHPDFLLHKLGHVLAFGFLGIFLYLALGRSLKWGVMLTAAFALSDEIHQYFVVGRSSRLGDVVLDVLAAAVFILVFQKLLPDRKGRVRRVK